MMNFKIGMRIAVLLFLLGCGVGASGQKNDYHWVIGYSAYPNVDVVFTNNSVDTMSKRRYVDMDVSQTSISDVHGDLQFYTNGGKLYSASDSIMQNGDSLNYGDGMEWNNYSGGAYLWVQEVLALPTDNPKIWNIIHYYVELQFNTYPFEFPWRVYQSRVDMSQDSGHGAVTLKNNTIIQDSIGSYVAACKHANGRDWWVLTSRSSSNCLHELLVQPDTTSDFGVQCMGANYLTGDAGQAAFTPDGTKFAWCGGPSGVNLYDFDRCSGTLSNPIHFPLYRTIDSVSQYGLAFSSNSRFLYVAQSKNIFQLDLQATNIWNSLDTIGFYQAPPDSTSFPAPYFLLQLGPNGKIYVCAGNSVRWLHVINQPDKKGDSCDFVNYGFPLPYNNGLGLPSYPNYRLEALGGSPCDTLSSLTGEIRASKEKIIKIFPNPASDYTIVDYGFTDWNKGAVGLQISNELGQVVYEQKLPMYSGYQKIDVSRFAAGIYNAQVIRNGAIIGVQKFVKE
ncbi:MAG: hypothetical protein JWO06_3044 [Bacteroidota bacterium]|nr:hypothetical protein [Bacteroidota bacterium]